MTAKEYFDENQFQVCPYFTRLIYSEHYIKHQYSNIFYDNSISYPYGLEILIVDGLISIEESIKIRSGVRKNETLIRITSPFMYDENIKAFMRKLYSDPLPFVKDRFDYVLNHNKERFKMLRITPNE